MLTTAPKSTIMYHIISTFTTNSQNTVESGRGSLKFSCHGKIAFCGTETGDVKVSENLDRNDGTDDKYVDLKLAAKYLISLFVETGKRYSCTRTKIGKLLSIVAFYYARRGRIVFSEKICKYKDCGTAIRELKGYVDLNVYLTAENKDDEKRIIDNLSVECCINCQNDITPPIGCVIEEVFRRFGAYSARSIGEIIGKCISNELYAVDGSVCLEKIETADLGSGKLSELLGYDFHV